MSYDIALHVKVAGCADTYAMIAEPEYPSPTYNIGTMLRACMNWKFHQSEKNDEGEWVTVYYPCDFVIDKVERGLRELRTNKKEYEQYDTPNGWGNNGWGNISTAVRTLESLRQCIYEQAEDIPLECLYMRW